MVPTPKAMARCLKTMAEKRARAWPGDGSLRHSYVICCTPRSGSNFQCEALTSTAVAGRPDEYFWNRPYWQQRWGVSEASEFTQRMLREGTSTNGVFGLKVTWEELKDAEALLKQLPNLRYVWLRRLDRVPQAISFYRALQTRRWRSTDASGDLPEPAFDCEAIKGLVQLCTSEDDACKQPQWRHQKQADALAEEWVRRYRTDECSSSNAS